MIIAIVTLLDDMFDSYGTPEECELLTNCIERFVFTILACKDFYPMFIKVNNTLDHKISKEQ